MSVCLKRDLYLPDSHPDSIIMMFVREIHSTFCALAKVEAASCDMKENFTANTRERSQHASQRALSEHVTEMQVRVHFFEMN